MKKSIPTFWMISISFFGFNINELWIAVLVSSAICLHTIESSAQQASEFKPETIKLYYYNSATPKEGIEQPSSAFNGPLNSKGIIEQQRINAQQQMGGGRPMLPSSDPSVNHHRMLQQYNRSQQQMALVNEVMEDLNSIKIIESMMGPAFYKSDKFRQSHAQYLMAKNVLSNMLLGKTELSLKRAFFAIESAFGDSYLDYPEYESIIERSAMFIKHWLAENGKPLNNLTLHYGIQSFMRDTLTISKQDRELNRTTKTQHLPFIYDYQDFRAEEDFRNYFVTKTLATGAGQCNSLPAAYLLLAEQLGTKAYLSFAPLHSFIKFTDDSGVIHNYEPTSHFEISDQWYAEHLYISANAYSNRLYLDTLNKQQIVASAMMDLAFGYLRKNGVADGRFIEECVNEAMAYFPRGEANVQGWLLRGNLLAAALHRMLSQKGIRDLKDIDKVPEATEVYQMLLGVEQKLPSLGYQELPTNLYDDLMQKQDTKAQQPGVNNKIKRNLFSTFK